jgi:hypothetical protein
VATGCLGGELSPNGATPDRGWNYRYVQDGVQLPTGSAATNMAADLDGNGSPDNRLGNVLGALANFGIDLQGKADEMIRAGNVIARDLVEDRGARWQVLLGESTSDPDFSGNGAFAIADNSPDDAVLTGHISQGRFEGGPAPVAVYMAIGRVPITFHLVGTQLRGSVSETDGDLYMAGGIMASEISTQLIPAAAQIINDYVAEHPGDANGMLEILDLDADGVVTAAELSQNELVSDLLEPDVDLLGGDDRPDSLSMAIGVRLARASF